MLVLTYPNPSVAVVTIDRPQRRNAMSRAMWTRMSELFFELASNDAVRAVVITGAGGYFCAGADITEFDALRANVERGEEYDREVTRATTAIAKIGKPTIAAISGYCIGGGMGLAQACDFRIADGSARFSIPAARLGIVYTLEECRSLVSLVGVAQAKRLLFTATRIDASEALQIGFIDQISSDAPLEAAIAFAREMIANAPLSIAGMKLILQCLVTNTADGRTSEISGAIHRALASEDYKEAIHAFKRKQKASFKGR